MSFIGADSSTDDFHSGYFEILIGQVVLISARKQMSVFGTFLLDGTIFVEGQLILED